jgi:hypothetical protein
MRWLDYRTGLYPLTRSILLIVCCLNIHCSNACSVAR